jgi:hypothetical protein
MKVRHVNVTMHEWLVPVPMRMRFSGWIGQASNAVSTPSRLSSSEVLDAGRLANPIISKTGATTPPEKTAPISHPQSERPKVGSIFPGLCRNLRADRQSVNPRPDPK